jgi:hypothetical protein
VFKVLEFFLILIGFLACECIVKEDIASSTNEIIEVVQTPIKSILTAEEQVGLTADKIIGRL